CPVFSARLTILIMYLRESLSGLPSSETAIMAPIPVWVVRDHPPVSTDFVEGNSPHNAIAFGELMARIPSSVRRTISWVLLTKTPVPSMAELTVAPDCPNWSRMPGRASGLLAGTTRFRAGFGGGGFAGPWSRGMVRDAILVRGGNSGVS